MATVNPATKRPRQGSNEEGSILICQKCDKEVKEKITCTGCKLHYCLQCAGVSVELYQCIQKGELNRFHWTCTCCQSMFPSLENIAGAIQDIQNKQDSRMKHLEDRMDKVEEANREEIKKGLNEIKSDVLQNLKADIDTLVDNRHRELEDRKRRELNVTVFNLPEHNNPSGLENKRQDEEDVTRICESIDVEELQIVTMYRLGRKMDSKTRPLKVILNNKAQRKLILNNAKLIERKAAPEYKRVIITKDLTPTQREERRKLVRAKKERRVQTNVNSNQQHPRQRTDDVSITPTNVSPVPMEFGFSAPSPILLRGGLPHMNMLDDSRLAPSQSQTQLQPYDESTIIGDNTIIGGYDLGSGADSQSQTNEVD